MLSNFSRSNFFNNNLIDVVVVNLKKSAIIIYFGWKSMSCKRPFPLLAGICPQRYSSWIHTSQFIYCSVHSKLKATEVPFIHPCNTETKARPWSVAPFKTWLSSQHLCFVVTQEKPECTLKRRLGLCIVWRALRSPSPAMSVALPATALQKNLNSVLRVLQIQQLTSTSSAPGTKGSPMLCIHNVWRARKLLWYMCLQTLLSLRYKAYRKVMKVNLTVL